MGHAVLKTISVIVFIQFSKIIFLLTLFSSYRYLILVSLLVRAWKSQNCRRLIVAAIVSRLEKLAEVFYTYVGDLQSVAAAVELDVEAVDVVFHYWLLKRKVAADTVTLHVYVVGKLPVIRYTTNILLEAHYRCCCCGGSRDFSIESHRSQ